ncbi:MAG: acetyl-CoA carboxylase biotin carboxyl carrier protein subunit [Hyphomicrobiales bacterium]
MKTFKFKIRGNDYEVEIKNFDNGTAELEVNGTPYQVEVEKSEKKQKTPILVRSAVPTPKNAHKIQKGSGGGGGGVTKVTAPLPGNIMTVFVKEGDSVSKGDKLLIYEAMKMENTLNVDRDGVIKSLKVNTGDSVLQGDVLLEIE